MKQINKWNHKFVVPFSVGVIMFVAIRLAEVLAGVQ